jgi:hypothetical protein
MFHSTANVFPNGRDFVRAIYGVVVTTPPICVATTSMCCMLFEASTVEYQAWENATTTLMLNITLLVKAAGRLIAQYAFIIYIQHSPQHSNHIFGLTYCFISTFLK